MQNDVTVTGDVAVIHLQKGMTTAIDLKDLPVARTINGRWHAARDRRFDQWYVQHVTPRPHRTTVALHRLISGAAPELEVDHIDHDGLNNRRSTNLRIVTTSRNQLNRKGASSRSSTGILGVDFNRAMAKFRGTIRVGKVYNHLGYFDTKEEAAAAIRVFRAARGIECPL